MQILNVHALAKTMKPRAEILVVNASSFKVSLFTKYQLRCMFFEMRLAAFYESCTLLNGDNTRWKQFSNARLAHFLYFYRSCSEDHLIRNTNTFVVNVELVIPLLFFGRFITRWSYCGFWLFLLWASLWVRNTEYFYFFFNAWLEKFKTLMLKITKRNYLQCSALTLKYAIWVYLHMGWAQRKYTEP